MGVIRKAIGIDPEHEGLTYRIRVFDHGHFIKQASVKDRGQRFIQMVVKPKDFFIFGEETKLAFQINPDIQPHYFGNIAEIDYDIRDSTQLGDLFDLCPNLVKELNENLYDTLQAIKDSKKKEEEKGDVIDAEWKEKKEGPKKEEETGADDPVIRALTDPAPGKGKTEPEQPEPSRLEQIATKIPGVPAITGGIDSIVASGHNFRTKLKGVNLLIGITYANNPEKQELMKKCFEFCMQPGNEKALRWLPKYLHIEPEVMGIVHQTELDGVGIMPMYYIKQTGAEIAEKMLTRPKTPGDWKETMILIIGLVAVLAIFAILILKLSGRI